MTSPIVVYQGESGAYSEQAAKELLGENVKTIGLDSFEKCFVALNEDRCDFAMIPIENSMGGSVHDCFDLQVRFDFNIVAELDFRVRHCLMALKGVTKENIEFVISHPQAIAQCEQYFRRNGLVSKTDYDTAGSAKKIFENQLFSYAAVASKLAAKVHNLEILEEGIEDDPNNVTRFFLLSKKCLIPPTTLELLKQEPEIHYKTAIVLSFENIPGALCRALSFFASNGIDLTKLESRPNKLNKKGKYLPKTLSTEVLELFSIDNIDVIEKKNDKASYPFIFYLDLIGSISEYKIIAALRKISAFCHFFRVLGSFPRFGVLQQFVATAVGVKNNTVTSGIVSTDKIVKEVSVKPQIKIALIGFGNFGQFLAKTFIGHHTIVACNRSDKHFEAMKLGISYYNTPTELLENEKDIDVIVFCTAILAFEKVIETIPPGLLENKLLVDVLSVKVFPKEYLQSFVKTNKLQATGILCTHPMFGPESGKFSWKNLPMMFEEVELPSEKHKLCSSLFLKIFEDEGCRMVEMSCEEHDKQAADSQFVTHFLGRSIDRLSIELPKDKAREISTTGFKSLLTIRDQTIKDSFDLFSALYLYNQNSLNTIKKLKHAMNTLVDDLEAVRQSSTSATEPIDLGSLYAPSDTVNSLATSGTGAIFALATKMRESGKDVLMSLCVGEPDFAPPRAVLDATKEAVDLGLTKYTTLKGTLPLRQAISKDLSNRKGLSYSTDEILVTPSGKQALFQVMAALLNSTDEVIVPAPYWTSYPELVKFGGGVPVIVDRSPNKNFILQPEELEEKITSRTKMLILCNPCNPTGCFYDKLALEKLADVLRKPENQKILVVADEIYERLVYDGLSSVSFATLEGMKERTILINGFSKAYAMTGYRLGYIAGNASLITHCTKLQSQLNSCASSISQHAGLAALNVKDEELHPLYDELQEKRDLIMSLLNAVPHLQIAQVTGAFYALPDVSYYLGSVTKEGKRIETSTELCSYLIEEFGVALVPGDSFGTGYTVRFSFATSKTDIVEAVKRFSKGLQSLKHE